MINVRFVFTADSTDALLLTASVIEIARTHSTEVESVEPWTTVQTVVVATVNKI